MNFPHFLTGFLTILITIRICFGQVDTVVNTRNGQPVNVINPMGPFVNINAENVKSTAAALKAIQEYNRNSANPDPKMQEEERKLQAEYVIATRVLRAPKTPVQSNRIPVDPNESRIRQEVYKEFGFSSADVTTSTDVAKGGFHSADVTRGGSHSAYISEDEKRQTSMEAAEAGLSVNQYEALSRLGKFKARNAAKKESEE